MEKPILFNTEMVKAIMEGRKTVTRRLIKPKYKGDECGFQVVTTNEGEFIRVEKIDENECGIFADGTERHVNPPYKVGDILYVRETWCKDGESYFFKADTDMDEAIIYMAINDLKWKPSIHMPKEAARIFLRVTDVRVERLQDITTEEILKEGVIQRFPNVNDEYTPDVLRGGFIGLWNSTIKDSDYNNYSYKANPWVWVIEFERIEKGNK